MSLVVTNAERCLHKMIDINWRLTFDLLSAQQYLKLSQKEKGFLLEIIAENIEVFGDLEGRVPAETITDETNPDHSCQD